jgi:hypothetical protein
MEKELRSVEYLVRYILLTESPVGLHDHLRVLESKPIFKNKIFLLSNKFSARNHNAFTIFVIALRTI